ncbi:hypothetical protein ACSBL2_12410 [Pedobacter sp. AW31-3R]|uniref:hypothetical protein n=1 Tax=Pedobacter sp. AW31-3R TaxID=3445781 RepID=UPI003FA0D917
MVKVKRSVFSLLLFLLSAVSLESFAQSEKKENYLNNYVKFDLSLGQNIDIPPSAAEKNAGLLGSRNRVVPFFAAKATHLFSEKFGWYGNLRIDFYKERKAEIYEENVFGKFFEDIFNSILGPISKIKPAFDAGMVYRIEQKRWSLMPSLGLGYASYGSNRFSSQTQTNDSGESVKLTYRQKAAFLSGNIGLSGTYYVGQQNYFTLNAGYQHPLQSSTALLIKEINGVEKERTSYRTNDAGRNIIIGIGYGVVFGSRK